MTTDRQKIADAVMLLLAHGFTISRNGATKSPPVQTAPAITPPAALTADGRAAYTCGQCHQPGHNARACPQKTQAAKPAAAPKVPAAKATPAPAVIPSASLDSLDFDLGDMGGAPTPAPKAQPAAPARKAAAPAAPVRKAAPAPVPTPEPEPEAEEGEAPDAELTSFLDDLEGLLP